LASASRTRPRSEMYSPLPESRDWSLRLNISSLFHGDPHLLSRSAATSCLIAAIRSRSRSSSCRRASRPPASSWLTSTAPPPAERPAPSLSNEGTPRTRQSLLTLAAFRPWGGSQDGRRAGSVGQSRGWPPATARHPDDGRPGRFVVPPTRA